jgi:hypothetical protein
MPQTSANQKSLTIYFYFIQYQYIEQFYIFLLLILSQNLQYCYNTFFAISD